MKIGIFISDIFFRIGGTEANCAYIFYALQQIFNYPEITLISEKYDDIKQQERNIVTHLNSCFALDIKDVNIKLELINANKTSFITRNIFEHRIKRASKKFDLFINVSINHFSFAAKKNIIIIHFPIRPKTKSPFVKKYPFMFIPAKIIDYKYSHNYDLYITYSQYSKEWLEKIWNIKEDKSITINPAVSLVSIPEKEKTISVFVCSRIERTKKIEMLIGAFLSSEQLKRTEKLVIAGATGDNETKSYVKELRATIGNYTDSIILHENPSRDDIENYYKTAKIFWHAKGYGVDEETDPAALEHFGLTTVEAMSAGCVPVVINKGGQKEIVDDGINGFKWDTPSELIEKTIFLLNNDDERRKISALAIKKAEEYSLENFVKNLAEVLNSYNE